MEFWGAEIKQGKPLKVTPEEENLIHISQAALGETKKIQKGESVLLFAKVGEQKFVLGTLSHENFPQINFDLVFDKEFELSHNWKNGSIHVIGYKSPNIDGEDECFSDSDASDEEELPVTVAENGKAKAVEIAKPANNAAVKPKAKAAAPTKDVESDSEDESDDDDDEDDESDSEAGMDVDDDDSDEDSEEEDEETPKKVEQIKKRPNESASKTPISSKKAKAATPPQKTDGKKGGHTATPYPAKKGGKASPFASQSPKSGGHSHGKNKNRSGK